jgi:glutamate dehydrogenase/leucine dehydrogenase
MAISILALVTNVLANDSGSVDVYFQVSHNGQYHEGDPVRAQFGTPMTTIIANVRDAAKDYAVTNLGATFEPGDSVLVFAPERTVL